MEEVIKESIKDIVERLREIPWFENCGNESAASRYEISYSKSIESAIKHCSSTRWGNLTLDKSQDISSYIIVYRVKTKYRWNEVVKIIKRDVLPELLEYVYSEWKIKYGEYDEIKKTIESNLIDFLALYAFRQYKEEPFHDELLNIYKQGYFPCGWKGTYPNGKIIIF